MDCKSGRGADGGSMKNSSYCWDNVLKWLAQTVVGHGSEEQRQTDFLQRAMEQRNVLCFASTVNNER